MTDTTPALTHFLELRRDTDRVIAMQAATIERCERINAIVIGPGRLTQLLTKERITAAEWAEIDALEAAALTQGAQP